LGDGQQQDLVKVVKLSDGIDIQHMGAVRFVPMVEGVPEV
jgi:protein-L-isoaspartate(D-aspartate) O-methyltransferase